MLNFGFPHETSRFKEKLNLLNFGKNQGAVSASRPASVTTAVSAVAAMPPLAFMIAKSE